MNPSTLPPTGKRLNSLVIRNVMVASKALTKFEYMVDGVRSSSNSSTCPKFAATIDEELKVPEGLANSLCN